MNPALAFVLIVLAIAIVVAVVVVRPLWRGRQAANDALAADRSNLDAVRIEWQELKRDRALGLIGEAAASEAERELEERVLAEAQPLAASTRDAATAIASPAVAGRYRKGAVALAVLMPVLSVFAYLLIGSPVAVVPELRNPGDAEAKAQMEELFRAAETKLAQEPGDLKGWTLLARAKASVGQFDGAMAAYERAVALDARNPDLWADYADAAAGQQQGRMDGRPIELIRKALALEPRHPKALLLLGTWQIQSERLDDAERTFRIAQGVVEPGTAFASIAENALRDIAGRRTASDSAAGRRTADVVAQPTLARIRVVLSEAAGAAAGAAPEAAVFVVLRAGDAPAGPPLAVKRLSPAQLASDVEFNAGDAMTGGPGLQPGARVQVRARLSLKGLPAAAAGDFESEIQTVTLPLGEALTLRVDTQR